MKFFLFALLMISHPFEEDILDGVNFLKENREIVSHINTTSNTNSKEALAIVFPELIRWSAFRNFLETKANELLYVQYGGGYANLSVGHFQMKPVFIEHLESYVANHAELASFDYIVLKEKSLTEMRRERMQRLNQLAWQLRYAHVYWLVATHKFKHRTFRSPQDRVRFFAIAYNHGFYRSEYEIEQRLHRKSFPFGVNYRGEQINYADISIEFYEKHANQFAL